MAVYLHCVENFEGLLQQCRRGRGRSKLWKNTIFPEHPVFIRKWISEKIKILRSWLYKLRSTQFAIKTCFWDAKLMWREVQPSFTNGSAPSIATIHCVSIANFQILIICKIKQDHPSPWSHQWMLPSCNFFVRSNHRIIENFKKFYSVFMYVL